MTDHIALVQAVDRVFVHFWYTSLCESYGPWFHTKFEYKYDIKRLTVDQWLPTGVPLRGVRGAAKY